MKRRPSGDPQIARVQKALTESEQQRMRAQETLRKIEANITVDPALFKMPVQAKTPGRREGGF